MGQMYDARSPVAQQCQRPRFCIVISLRCWVGCSHPGFKLPREEAEGGAWQTLFRRAESFWPARTPNRKGAKERHRAEVRWTGDVGLGTWDLGPGGAGKPLPLWAACRS